MNEELKQIKKLYGEEMMHLCRELFPTILETEGLLLETLKKNIAPTHSFYDCFRFYSVTEPFKDWIFSLINKKKQEKKDTDKDPFELMDEAGYTLYECKTEQDIQRFTKYYAPGELLCTFNGGRLDRCYVFFAVKKNVDKIKREDFKKPQREDEYGTSVISIQFSKGVINTLSIKNRYNHTVNNPDATFSNNLEKIIPGLTNSFETKYHFKINQQNNDRFEQTLSNSNYVKANDDRFYKYNYESNGIFYCENNYIIKDGNIITKYHDNPERYLLIDKYIIDLKEKTVETFENDKDTAFVKSINDVGKIRKITIAKDKNYKMDNLYSDKENRIITIYYENYREVKITINERNAIVGYENDYVRKIDDNFLYENIQRIQKISLKNVKNIGKRFLTFNHSISEIDFPELETMGDDFLKCNRLIRKINLPKLKEIGDTCFEMNTVLDTLSLPEVRIIGYNFFGENTKIKSIDLPKVEKVGNYFLRSNTKLEKLSMPEVKEIGHSFLTYNNCLKELSIPKVEKVGNYFLQSNTKLEKLSMPEVKEIGHCFLTYNNCLKELSIPKVEIIGARFLIHNKTLNNLYIPNIKRIGIDFLRDNRLIDKKPFLEKNMVHEFDELFNKRKNQMR